MIERILVGPGGTAVTPAAIRYDVVLPQLQKPERVFPFRENRLRGLAIHLLIGLSLFLVPLL